MLSRAAYALCLWGRAQLQAGLYLPRVLLAVRVEPLAGGGGAGCRVERLTGECVGVLAVPTASTLGELRAVAASARAPGEARRYRAVLASVDGWALKGPDGTLLQATVLGDELVAAGIRPPQPRSRSGLRLRLQKLLRGGATVNPRMRTPSRELQGGTPEAPCDGAHC